MSGDAARQCATAPRSLGQGLSAESVPRLGAMTRSLCPREGQGARCWTVMSVHPEGCPGTLTSGFADKAGLHLRACHRHGPCSCAPWSRPSACPASERHVPARVDKGSRPSASAHLQSRFPRMKRRKCCHRAGHDGHRWDNKET